MFYIHLQSLKLAGTVKFKLFKDLNIILGFSFEALRANADVHVYVRLCQCRDVALSDS